MVTSEPPKTYRSRQPRQRGAGSLENVAPRETVAPPQVKRDAAQYGGLAERLQAVQDDYKELIEQRAGAGKFQFEKTAQAASRLQALDQYPPKAGRGDVERALGTDPRNKYDLQYKVVEAGDLITSNTLGGGVNPDYPQELQPRDRSRAASQAQIRTIARGLDSDALLLRTPSIDRGAPIVGDDDIVESGNGRALALLMASESYPQQFDQYRADLVAAAPGLGINPDDIQNYDNPVLVRERLTQVDRVEFAAEANQSAVLGRSSGERAQTDSALISSDSLANFEPGAGNVDEAILAQRNRDFTRSFMGRLPITEQAEMLDNSGQLSQSGKARIKAAMFNRVFESPRLANKVFEESSAGQKRVVSGIMSALPRLAVASEKIERGERSAELAITQDVATALDKLDEISKDPNQTVSEYLGQGQLFAESEGGRELSTRQESLLLALHNRRNSGKAVREYLERWADIVELSNNPNQGSLAFGDAPEWETIMQEWLDGA